MSTFPTARLLALSAALGLSSTCAAAQGPETDKCNENQGLHAMALDPGPIGGAMSGTPLDPGETWPTPGTNATDSPELIGTLEFELTGKFKSPDGELRGSYIERTYNGADNRCKQHLRFKVKQGCVVKVRFNKYAHPLDPDRPLFADYRNDWPLGDVAPAAASRSPGKGLVIDFHMDRPVCAGETSNWLLLNTSIQPMVVIKGLQFIGPVGEASVLRPIHVPLR